MSRQDSVERYYRLHAHIYDATRWSFLFGRGESVAWMGEGAPPKRVLEVGCGTGRNLARIAEAYPDAEVSGVDLSSAMLERAAAQVKRFGDRVTLHEEAYGSSDRFTGWPDVILFSYSLTMMGEALGSVLDQARRDLAPGGRVIVVDFHDTPLPVFRTWMGRNHVDVRGSVRPELERRFRCTRSDVRSAYVGLWSWLLWEGRAPEDAADGSTTA